MDNTIDQQVVKQVFDELQQAALLVQRLAVVARQQQIDTAEAIAALERAVATFQSALREKDGP